MDMEMKLVPFIANDGLTLSILNILRAYLRPCPNKLKRFNKKHQACFFLCYFLKAISLHF